MLQLRAEPGSVIDARRSNQPDHRRQEALPVGTETAAVSQPLGAAEWIIYTSELRLRRGR